MGNGESRRPGWRGWLASTLLGAAGELAVSDVSNAGFRWQAGVVTAAAVVAAAVWIRKLPASARLSQYGSWLFLTPAAAVALAAAFSPRSSTGMLTAMAVILTAGVLILASDLEIAARLLGGAALTGLGFAFVALGGTLLLGPRVVLGTALLFLGFALVGTGIALLADREMLLGVAVLALALAFVGLGAMVGATGHVPTSAALIGIGAAFAGLGGTLVAEWELIVFMRELITYTAAIVSGGMVIWTGVTFAANGQAMVGSALFVLGIAVTGTGVAWLVPRVRPYALIVSGAAALWSGVAWHPSRLALMLAAGIVGGAALIAFAEDEHKPFSRWFSSLTEPRTR